MTTDSLLARYTVITLKGDSVDGQNGRHYALFGEVQIGVTRQPPDAAVMVDNGRPFFQLWCVHESIRWRGSKAV